MAEIPESPPNPLVPIIATFVTFLGTAAPLLYTIWKEHNSTAKRIAAFEDAKKELDFWDARLKVFVATLSGEALEKVKAETNIKVEHVCTRLAATVNPTLEPHLLERLRVNRIQRVFLLYKFRLDSYLAWYQRFILLSCCCVTVVWIWNEFQWAYSQPVAHSGVLTTLWGYTVLVLAALGLMILTINLSELRRLKREHEFYVSANVSPNAD